MGPRQQARFAGQALLEARDRARERSGMTDAQLDDAMRIMIRLKNYGNQQRCECGRLGYLVSRVYPDHTVYRCPCCGKILSATPQQIAQGVSP